MGAVPPRPGGDLRGPRAARGARGRLGAARRIAAPRRLRRPPGLLAPRHGQRDDREARAAGARRPRDRGPRARPRSLANAPPGPAARARRPRRVRRLRGARLHVGHAHVRGLSRAPRHVAPARAGMADGAPRARRGGARSRLAADVDGHLHRQPLPDRCAGRARHHRAARRARPRLAVPAVPDLPGGRHRPRARVDRGAAHAPPLADGARRLRGRATRDRRRLRAAGVDQGDRDAGDGRDARRGARRGGARGPAGALAAAGCDRGRGDAGDPGTGGDPLPRRAGAGRRRRVRDPARATARARGHALARLGGGGRDRRGAAGPGIAEDRDHRHAGHPVDDHRHRQPRAPTGPRPGARAMADRRLPLPADEQPPVTRRAAVALRRGGGARPALGGCAAGVGAAHARGHDRPRVALPARPRRALRRRQGAHAPVAGGAAAGDDRGGEPPARAPEGREHRRERGARRRSAVVQRARLPRRLGRPVRPLLRAADAQRPARRQGARDSTSTTSSQSTSCATRRGSRSPSSPRGIATVRTTPTRSSIPNAGRASRRRSTWTTSRSSTPRARRT